MYPGRLRYELYRVIFVSYDKPPVLLNARIREALEAQPV